MRALVLQCEPDSAAADGGEIPLLLAELGCDVHTARFDLADLSRATITQRPVVIAIVDIGRDANRARFALRCLAGDDDLATVPTLAAIDVIHLANIDFARGYDDFIVKPVVGAELYARVRQLDWRTSSFDSDEIVKIGSLVIDVAGHEARLAGRPVAFTPQEFELLRFMAQHRGRVFSREQLLSNVWGSGYSGGDRTVDIHVRRLRAKLGAVAGGLIETVRNVGYKIRAADE